MPVSQREIYALLRELGGDASRDELKAAAKEKWPRLSLYQYVHVPLKRLVTWGYVEQYEVDGKRRWRIIRDYEEDAS